MLRILLLVPAALIAWAGAAAASDCLNVVDGFSVEYDLPAAMSLADASTAAADREVLTAKPVEGQGAIERTTPAGRPGLARLTSRGPAPVFAERSKLTPEQSRQIQELLHRARSAEALGNEDECMAAFNEAQRVVAAHAPATKPRNRHSDGK